MNSTHRVWSLSTWFVWATVCVSTGAADDKYELQTIRNSETFSQVIAANDRGQVLGVKEVNEKGISSLRNFFRSGNKEIELPPPNGFTNIEVQALSDSSMIVGYVSRPRGSRGGSIHAFAFDTNSGQMEILPPLEGGQVSNAQDISSDGSIITGYSISDNPASMLPCLWKRDDSSKAWVCYRLSSILEYNPYLQASHVVISPNGKYIAACISVRKYSDQIYDSSLFVWETNEKGDWERREISEEQFAIKDINDHGEIVGTLTEETISTACRVNLAGKLERFKPLPEDESSYANGINNAGTMIGTSDSHGNEGGPQAVLFKDGKSVPLVLRENTVDSSAIGINQSGAIYGFILIGQKEDEVVEGFVAIPIANKN